MKNTLGNNMTVTIFGESHGPFIGCVLDGLAPGLKIDEAFINHGISLGVYSSSVYNSECQNINAAEFNQCISSDHVDAQYKACNRNTLEWLFKNRV